MYIAILGATSHIAKGLICRLLENEGLHLSLFARSPCRVAAFLASEGLDEGRCQVEGFQAFASGRYDVIINCVGIGSPQKLKDNLGDIFRITEEYDNLALDYLQLHPVTRYISFSSGAAYGLNFTHPVDESSYACFALNRLSPEEYYGISKLHSEAKHRSLGNYNIVDLRIFGYFSRFIDLEEKFLMSDVVRAIIAGQELVTGPSDIVRDYVHPDDLLGLVLLCLQQGCLNCVFDVYSVQSATKFEILEMFRDKFGLSYRIDPNYKPSMVTGTKDHYYSNGKTAGRIGYQPRFTTLDALIKEFEELFFKSTSTNAIHKIPS